MNFHFLNIRIIIIIIITKLTYFNDYVDFFVIIATRQPSERVHISFIYVVLLLYFKKRKIVTYFKKMQNK